MNYFGRNYYYSDESNIWYTICHWCFFKYEDAHILKGLYEESAVHDAAYRCYDLHEWKQKCTNHFAQRHNDIIRGDINLRRIFREIDKYYSSLQI